MELQPSKYNFIFTQNWFFPLFAHSYSLYYATSLTLLTSLDSNHLITLSLAIHSNKSPQLSSYSPNTNLQQKNAFWRHRHVAYCNLRMYDPITVWWILLDGGIKYVYDTLWKMWRMYVYVCLIDWLFDWDVTACFARKLQIQNLFTAK